MNEVNLIPTKVYAARLKDKDALKKSSSGGAFTALSNVFLENGDAVVCAVYNYETHAVEFKLVLDSQSRDAARGSKYIQSFPGDSFEFAFDWLHKHPKKRLLFVGMGCQVDAFRKYSEKFEIRNRVYLVDIICHGSPSPEIWRKYVSSFSKLITEVQFRAKRNEDGWRKPMAYLVQENREYALKDYMKVFYSNYALRPSCYTCPYATTERKVDITIGDYWHIEDKLSDFWSIDGNSLLLIYTSRGMELFEEIKSKVEFAESNTVDCWQKNLEYPTPQPRNRNQFWQEYKEYGVEHIMKKYGHDSLAKRGYNKMKRIIIGTIRKAGGDTV